MVKTVECPSCELGIIMCKTAPCILAPLEVRNLLNHDPSLHNFLMIDWWDKAGKENDPEFYFLSCAIAGYEKKLAPELPTNAEENKSWRKGRCTFLDKNNLCKLHPLNLKPIQGAAACCKQTHSGFLIHSQIAHSWDNQQAQELIFELAKIWRIKLGAENA